MKRIVINHELFPEVVNSILGDFDVHVVPDLNAAHPSLREAHAVITLLSTRVDTAFLDAAPHLQVVANYAVGVDNIDRVACETRNVVVTHTPDVLTDATAELAVGLLFACARHIVAADAYVRRGEFDGWRPGLYLGHALAGRRALIVGGGRIGKKTAALFSAVGLVVDILPRHADNAAIDAALSNTDVLSLHMPYTPATHHWLNAERIARLSPQSIVLNTARGPVIDEGALIAALAAKAIYAAGLDVYENEPAVPAALSALENVVLMPHIGSATDAARGAMMRLCCDGIAAVLRGERAPNVAPLPSHR